MTRNIRLTIEYEGTGYEGWQVQKAPKAGRKNTVQAELEAALSAITGGKVKVTGSGRTDAGVHAGAQVANFVTHSNIPCRNLQKALNSSLPRDISVTGCEDVPEAFHSRYSAKWKLYRYTILNRPCPSALRRNFTLFCDYRLDLRMMRAEAAALKGTHDFTSFHAAGAAKGSSERTIRMITVGRRADEVIIEVEANGFLKNMVRTIAGTLIEIGRGKLPRGAMKRILAARNRKAAGPTAPPQGLCLIRVEY